MWLCGDEKLMLVDMSPVSMSDPEFELDYDYLVVATGAKNNTFRTPGVYEHANFLKGSPTCFVRSSLNHLAFARIPTLVSAYSLLTIVLEDAIAIRKVIVDNFETANLPNSTIEAPRSKFLW